MCTHHPRGPGTQRHRKHLLASLEGSCRRYWDSFRRCCMKAPVRSCSLKQSTKDRTKKKGSEEGKGPSGTGKRRATERKRRAERDRLRTIDRAGRNWRTNFGTNFTHQVVFVCSAPRLRYLSVKALPGKHRRTLEGVWFLVRNSGDRSDFPAVGSGNNIERWSIIITTNFVQ